MGGTARNFICPLTESACTDGRCLRDRCFIQSEDETRERAEAALHAHEDQLIARNYLTHAHDIEAQRSAKKKDAEELRKWLAFVLAIAVAGGLAVFQFLVRK